MKFVQKNNQGVLRPQDGSKLRSESNGMPPGAQIPNEKLKKPENTTKTTKIHSLLSPIGGSIYISYRAL